MHADAISARAGGRTVDVAALRRDLAAAPVTTGTRGQDGLTEHVSVLTLTADGTLTVARDGADGDAPFVSVNREFLLQALNAVGRRQLELEFGGVVVPPAVRVPDDAGVFSLLMPVRMPVRPLGA